MKTFLLESKNINTLGFTNTQVNTTTDIIHVDASLVRKKRDTGNAIVNTWSKAASANFSLSNEPTGVILLS